MFTVFQALSARSMLTHPTFIITLCGRHWYPHFMGEKTEIQKAQEAGSGPHSHSVAELGSAAQQFASRVSSLLSALRGTESDAVRVIQFNARDRFLGGHKTTAVFHIY